MGPTTKTREHTQGDESLASKCACNFSADEVASALVAKLTDPVVAEAIMNTWGGKVDQQLGRGLRRFGVYVFVALLGVGALKLGIIEKFLKALAP